MFNKHQLPRIAVWSVLAEAYKAKGDQEEANAAFQNALEINLRHAWFQKMVRDGEMEISARLYRHVS